MAWLQTQTENQQNASKTQQNATIAYASSQEIEYFFQRTEQLYQQLGFIQNQGVMAKLRRLYQRAALEQNELNILLGMLSAVEKKLPSAK